MTNFRTKWNYVREKGEINTQPSKTIPNQSFSVQEILSRWTRGLPISGQKVPEYHGEDLLPNLKKLDFAEIEILKQDIRDNMDLAKSKLQEQIKQFNLAEQQQRELHLTKRLEQLEKRLQTNESIPPNGTHKNENSL